MAESYIAALSADFDPSEFADGYREALEEVIEAKVAGREVVTPEEQPASSGQVVDLMEALRRSVAEAKSRRGEGDGPAEKAATKPAARKAAGTAAKTTGAPPKKAAKSAAKKSAAKTTKKSAAKSTSKKTAARKSA